MRSMKWRAGPLSGLVLLGLMTVIGCGSGDDNKSDAKSDTKLSSDTTTAKQTPAKETAAQPDPATKQPVQPEADKTASPETKEPVAVALLSGLQPGDPAKAFNVHDVTGPAAGTSLCYR